MLRRDGNTIAVERIVGDRRYENNGWTNIPEFDDKNPIILVNHNKNDPIGTALNTRVEGDKLKFKLKLAPAGTSIKADECRALVRAKILRGMRCDAEATRH